jgi:hypothetical protein
MNQFCLNSLIINHSPQSHLQLCVLELFLKPKIDLRSVALIVFDQVLAGEAVDEDGLEGLVLREQQVEELFVLEGALIHVEH